MARFSGKMYRGAGREDRAERRFEAERRTAQTPPDRRRAARREAERNCE